MYIVHSYQQKNKYKLPIHVIVNTLRNYCILRKPPVIRTLPGELLLIVPTGIISFV